LTHSHIDHIGVPSRLAAANKKLKVHVHEEEWYLVNASDSEREALRDVLATIIGSWGIPGEIIELMREKLIKALRMGGGIPRDQVLPYPKHEALQVGGIKMDAVHCPGHTEGLVCLWWPETGNLFSNDHVLESITPNPTIYLKSRKGKRCGLGDYLNSLSNVEHLPIKQVLPGHGDAFTDLKGRISEIRTMASERRDRLLQNLVGAANEPMSIIELTQKIWGDMDPVHTFLGAREVHGFLEMLLEDGTVKSENVAGVTRFSPTGALSFGETGLAAEPPVMQK
jgi:glyoxylase-like metal-dependent hydrolase (beta-lactamase superfamily II)